MKMYTYIYIQNITITYTEYVNVKIVRNVCPQLLIIIFLNCNAMEMYFY